MNISGEVKIIGDSYAGGYSCGLTMGDSGTMEKFQLKAETTCERRYETEDGLSLTV